MYITRTSHVTNESRHERVTSYIYVYVLLWIMYTMYICVYIYIPNAPCICISMSNHVYTYIYMEYHVYTYIYMVHKCTMHLYIHVQHNKIWIHIHICTNVYAYVRVRLYVRACVRMFVRMCVYMRISSLSRVWGTWLIHMWDMVHSHVGHDSFTCGPWLIHTWDMTHLKALFAVILLLAARFVNVPYMVYSTFSEVR